jgi:hypothetical protein
MATDALALVGTIAGALIAAGGSSLLVVSQYQAAKRKRQPVLVEADEWKEVISAQRVYLKFVEDVFTVLSRPRASSKQLSKYAALHKTLADGWPVARKSPDRLLTLREGRKAFGAYRSLNTSLAYLRTYSEQEAQIHNGSQRAVLEILNHGAGHYVRLIFRKNADSYERRIIRQLSRMQKYLVEVSYLQPSPLVPQDSGSQQSPGSS